MSTTTKIEWTDATWNPVRGCKKVSPGCKNCYAEAFAERFRGVPGHPYEQGFDPRVVPAQLNAPLHWRAPRRVFVNSMSDLFQEDCPDKFIAAVFGVMGACSQHTFQILTKQPVRMRCWFDWILRRVDDGRLWFPAENPLWLVWQLCYSAARRYDAEVPSHHGGAWPLPNVHLGVSVEAADYKDRILLLHKSPAARRFVSFEPLLEDVGKLDLGGIHQVIVGAESGPRARPMREDWVRSIRDQAKAQGVAFFYKQRIEKGRKVSLPLLDGQQWAEHPT